MKLPTKTKIYFVFLFLVTTMLVTSPFLVNDVFAINAFTFNDAFDKNLPHEFKWQLVFISSTPACSNYHYQMMSTYYDVAQQYLKLYEFENISYEPLCLTEKKYLSNYESPSDLDLIILVYDKNLGEKELHANQMGGLYTHYGTDKTQNHVIIICDCPNFDYSSPVWILSHELSHFILYYKNFETSVIERLIHVNDIKFDQCLKESTTCKSSSIKMVAGPGGYAYSVMPIYQPAVGTQTENENTSENNISLVSSELSKIITHWWATGIISDTQYSNAIGYLIDSSSISFQDESNLILADGPLDDTITWEQMMEEITPTYWDREQKSEDESMAYLAKIPSNMISSNKNLNLGMPEWFKETASLWGQDVITDKEFKKNIEYLVKKGLIEPSSSDVFQNIVIESESILKSTSQNPNYNQNLDESLSQNPILEDFSVEQVDSESENRLEEFFKQAKENAPSKIITEIENNSPTESITEIEKNPTNEDITETEKNITVKKEGIHKLAESVNAIPDIDFRVMKNLEPAIASFDEGNINDACINLENFFIILEYLIESNKIDQSLGLQLIADGEILKLDLCN